MEVHNLNTAYSLLFLVHNFVLLGKWRIMRWLVSVWVASRRDIKTDAKLIRLCRVSDSEATGFTPVCHSLPSFEGSQKPALFICFRSLSDGFQWSFKQQASNVIDVAVGSDISLPCEYELTPQEQQEARTFHLLTWTREQPMNSKNWTGLAIKSTLTASKVIYDDPQRIFITNDTLVVKNVAVQDRTRYQCSFQSSFFTTPSTIELNVQCEYYYAKITFTFPRGSNLGLGNK